MQPPTRPLRNVVLGAILAVAALGYARVAWLQYSAYRHASSGSIQQTGIAVRLQPENADYWQLLGGLQVMAFETQAAMKSLQRSADLNPWNARTWLMLAALYQVAGEDAKQESALNHAYADDPKTPSVAWELANHYLARGDAPKALGLFRTVVESDPEQRVNAFRLAWKETHNVDAMLGIVPDNADIHLQLLAFMTALGESQAAERIWKSTVALGQPIPNDEACKYVDYLIGRHEVASASGAWNDTIAVNHSDLIQRTNMVVNGDFEEPITGCGFDWHYRGIAGVQVSIDSMEGKSGTQSLSVRFANSTPGDIGLFQYVPVTPGETYDFSAFARSEGIQSSSGPRFGVFDAYTGKQYMLTDDLLETNVWREESASFTAGPETQLVVIRIVRVPGNTAIEGKLWIDDVRIVKR
jgi:Carbohydrate binding domain